MPYIPKSDRSEFEADIASIVNKLVSHDENDAKGKLNYIIFSICYQIVMRRGIRYFRLQDVYGTMTSCAAEFYRRVIGPYEDQAIEKNGDVL